MGIIQKTVFLWIGFFSFFNVFSQSSQSVVKNEISRQGFSDPTSFDCEAMIQVKMNSNQESVMASSQHFIDKLNDMQYQIQLNKNATSVWYKLVIESDRDLNFSIYPLQENNLKFVLYELSENIECPTLEDMIVSRAVLSDQVESQKGLGLTGEATSNYDDPKSLNNILYFTPYHQSIYVKKSTIYLLNIRSSKQVLSHILQFGKTSIKLEEQKAEKPKVNEQENLKAFLYGKKMPENENNPASLKANYHYDHMFFEPPKDPEEEIEEVNIPAYIPPMNDSMAAVINNVYVDEKNTMAQNEVKNQLENTSISIKNNEEKSTSNIVSENKSLVIKPENTVIEAKMFFEDGSVAKNIQVYVTDLSLQTNYPMLTLRTDENGIVYIPKGSEHIFVSLNSEDPSLKGKPAISMQGTIYPGNNIKMYGAVLHDASKFSVKKLSYVGYGKSNYSSTSITEDFNNVNYKDPKEYNRMVERIGSVPMDGVTFKVQVGAYKDIRKFKTEKFNSYGEVEVYKLDDGITRFTLGNYKLLIDAEKLRQNLLSAGFRDVFIVAFENGKRKKELR